MDCTLISIRGEDLAPWADRDDEEGICLDELATHPSLGVGGAWGLLHVSLGNHEVGHPLAFLEDGGADVPALQDEVTSWARYFDVTEVRAIEHALGTVSDAQLVENFALRDQLDPLDLYPAGLRPYCPDDAITEASALRAFLANVVAAESGLLVHLAG